MSILSLPSLPVATLGVPRIGPRRELKAALESHWSGASDAAALAATAAGLRAASWAGQAARGVDILPSNDFSLYDQVLDMAVLVGAVPAAHAAAGAPLDVYFAMARGSRGRAEACCGGAHDGGGLPALEMTKWFDTNYHYMVPEFVGDQTFRLAGDKPFVEFAEAKALGFPTRPVLIGPVSFLKLGKRVDGGDPLALLPRLLPVYAEILRRMAAAGADWVQIDEPCLVLDLNAAARAGYRTAYEALAAAGPKIMLATYFGGLGDNLPLALSLPVAGLHVDLVRAPEQLDAVVAGARPDLVLSLGVIDGRNVWRADLGALLDRLEPAVAALGADRVQLAPSCSLLHVPHDLELETALDPALKQWLAFAKQKMDELAVLGRALANGRDAARDALDASAAAAARRSSPLIHDPAVAARAAAVTPAMSRRAAPYEARRQVQREAIRLPSYPTTTIGSFPQTEAVRRARAAHDKGALDDAGYDAFLKSETKAAIRWQEEIGLDMLVHGEFERNDMVQYFGEKLAGFAFTRAGWVQSYGSRCVRPPIVYGDVSRPAPMTVAWSTYARSLTERPMKGMLTGPVTILQWSFIRDDLPRAAVCRQIALALRDEVIDLEAVGLQAIQIDEPALREGLPLRRADWAVYLAWAGECFRLAASGVRDGTQIHTHMCYAAFNDIIDAIGALDADVISIESSRSRMELLEAFSAYRYPNEIGPGVYDIHSPRVPSAGEMAELLRAAGRHLSPAQIWVNPDCGLKTRRWEEVRPALANMVEAARILRGEAA